MAANVTNIHIVAGKTFSDGNSATYTLYAFAPPPGQQAAWLYHIANSSGTLITSQAMTIAQAIQFCNSKGLSNTN